MFHNRSTALPAAVCLITVVSACQDAPLAPRSAATHVGVRDSVSHSSNVHIYSGAAADSAVTAILTAWAANGHPEYLESRAAFNRGANVSAGGVTKERAATRSLLLSDGDGGSDDAYADPPLIAAHREQVYFGQYSGATQIPTMLNASMQFVGARGSIDANVTISGKGVVYPVNGSIADGAGTLINCTDMMFSSCTTKSLEGALVMNNAPYCDATATGSIMFTAKNVDATAGSIVPLSSTGGWPSAPAVVTGYVNNTSAACDTKQDDQPTNPAPGGGGAPDPNPNPTWPTPTQPEYPAPDPGPTGLGDNWHCETTTWYFAGQPFAQQVNCYNDN